MLPRAKLSVQATKASAENLNLLQAGKGEVPFALGDTLSHACKGDAEAGFAAPLKKLRRIAGICPNYIQIVASADSGSKALADLKGKRVSVGAPKSGAELNARAVPKAAWLSYKDLAKIEYLPFGESVELMKNRPLDVTLQSAGLGVSALRDLSASMKIGRRDFRPMWWSRSAIRRTSQRSFRRASTKATPGTCRRIAIQNQIDWLRLVKARRRRDRFERLPVMTTLVPKGDVSRLLGPPRSAEGAPAPRRWSQPGPPT